MSLPLVKIVIRHVHGDDVDIETPWAKALGDDLYELDNLPWYAYGVSCGDVVEAFVGDDGRPEMTRVVKKSGNRTVRVIFESPVPSTEESNDVLDALVSMGCSYEGLNRRYFSINVPPAADHTAVCAFLTKAELTWEYADPTYAQLYPTTDAG
jgi:hypothetical protein